MFGEEVVVNSLGRPRAVGALIGTWVGILSLAAILTACGSEPFASSEDSAASPTAPVSSPSPSSLATTEVTHSEFVHLVRSLAEAHPECDAGSSMLEVNTFYLPRDCERPAWVDCYSNVDVVSVDYSLAEASQAYLLVRAAIDEVPEAIGSLETGFEAETNSWAIVASPDDVSTVQQIIDDLAGPWEDQWGARFPVIVRAGVPVESVDYSD